MHILQICSKPPFPPQDGGTLAMNILTRGLLDCGHKVKVLTVNTSKHFVDISKVPENYKQETNYEAVFIDTSIRPLKALINLFSKRSYNVERFYSTEFQKVLIGLLKSQDFDVIQFETLWVSVNLDTIRKYSKAKIVLRSQNVEFAIWERLADNTSNPIKKWYLNLLASRLKNYELDMMNKYDAIAAITKEDMKVFTALGCKIPMIHVPFGIDLNAYSVNHNHLEHKSFFHIGAMDWLPNAEGIKWLVEEVWPRVIQKKPELKLYLAGRKMPQWLLDLKLKNVVVVGEVNDAQQFIQSYEISLVPLFSGSGMRVKIIEGIAMGKVIISTSIGAEGIDYRVGENILIADSIDAFVDAIVNCAEDELLVKHLGANARKLAEEKYDNALICKKLAEFYQQIISN